MPSFRLIVQLYQQYDNIKSDVSSMASSILSAMIAFLEMAPRIKAL